MKKYIIIIFIIPLIFSYKKSISSIENKSKNKSENKIAVKRKSPYLNTIETVDPVETKKATQGNPGLTEKQIENCRKALNEGAKIFDEYIDLGNKIFASEAKGFEETAKKVKEEIEELKSKIYLYARSFPENIVKSIDKNIALLKKEILKKQALDEEQKEREKGKNSNEIKQEETKNKIIEEIKKLEELQEAEVDNKNKEIIKTNLNSKKKELEEIKRKEIKEEEKKEIKIDISNINNELKFYLYTIEIAQKEKADLNLDTKKSTSIINECKDILTINKEENKICQEIIDVFELILKKKKLLAEQESSPASKISTEKK